MMTAGKDDDDGRGGGEGGDSVLEEERRWRSKINKGNNLDNFGEKYLECKVSKRGGSNNRPLG